ncbi:MAG: FixH family protein [Burkholderiales bacterium]|nr:FixH family protein [Burkholderiales bacterium]
MKPKRRTAAGLALSALLAASPAAYAACDAGPGVLRGETSKVALAFRTTPPVIKVGELFSLRAEVCPQAGTRVSGLKVDASMPAHKHGMNYQPRVRQTGPGSYAATGLMFHMPGRWQFTFDVETPAGRERIHVDYTAE